MWRREGSNKCVFVVSIGIILCKESSNVKSVCFCTFGNIGMPVVEKQLKEKNTGREWCSGVSFVHELFFFFLTCPYRFVLQYFFCFFVSTPSWRHLITILTQDRKLTRSAFLSIIRFSWCSFRNLVRLLKSGFFFLLLLQRFLLYVGILFFFVFVISIMWPKLLFLSVSSWLLQVDLVERRITFHCFSSLFNFLHVA